jgi:hypothetical protein
MAENQLVPAGFSYATLADANTFELARNDLSAWLNSLNLPVIIDEAQRIPSLPLEIKEIVDKTTSQGIRFLLTGSAVINRNGLDGQDPLARRAQRFTMSPLTQREFHHIPGSIVDDLWSAEPNTNFEQETSRTELYDLMAAGGFPEYSSQYSMYEEWERERLIADDIQTVLGDTILPDEKLDAVIAESILGKLLCVPGGHPQRQRNRRFPRLGPQDRGSLYQHLHPPIPDPRITQYQNRTQPAKLHPRKNPSD